MRRKEKQGLFSKKNLISFLIVFLMVSSVIGFMWGRGDVEKHKYKEYNFYRKENKWAININKQEIMFDSFPSDIEDIDLDSQIINRILNTLEVDSTYDINDKYSNEIAAAQYGLGLGLNVLNIYMVNGLTEETEYNLPVVTCDTATMHVPVIYFKQSNETKISMEDNCIILEGKNDIDFIKLKDRILYGVFGIIE